MKAVLACLLIGLVNSCNNYTDTITDNTFLCNLQACSNNVISYNGSPCQCGCCFDGLCDATACDAKQLEYATFAILIASVVLTVIFGTLYFILYAKKSKAGQAKKNDDNRRVDGNW